jgi:AcrR family transcriptional regulator
VIASESERRPASRTFTPREEILEVAGRLFAEGGFAATSTRAIALAVGIKQASLYYHFRGKDEILASLLRESIEPSLEFLERTRASCASAPVQLYALTHFDTAAGLGRFADARALYQLPELRTPRFVEFRAHRQRHREAYRALIAAGAEGGVFQPSGSVEVMTDLVLAFAANAIAIQGRRGPDPAAIVARGCLRLLCCPTRVIERAAAEALRLFGTALAR